MILMGWSSEVRGEIDRRGEVGMRRGWERGVHRTH